MIDQFICLRVAFIRYMKFFKFLQQMITRACHATFALSERNISQA